MKKIAVFVLLLVFVTTGSHGVAASDSAPAKDEKPEVEYHDTSLKNFAKTYWRFSKFDVEDDAVIDNFMKISECDLYQEYVHNEFEWNSIRESTREFLTENKKKFPARYQIVQPISVDEYDFEKQGFNIAEEHAFKGVKRFEVPSNELYKEVCGTKLAIPYYPKAIALELTRPMIFDFFEVDEPTASRVIAEKMANYENLRQQYKHRDNYLKAREVYLVAKVKIFAYKEGDFQTQLAYKIARMLGILERIEIYEDKDLTKLLYAKDFRRKKAKKKKEF